MLCPIDQTELVMTERQGVEIDYCPKCRGVWLDRGELDKIIERAGQADASSAGASAGADARDSFLTPKVGDMQGRVRQFDTDDDDWDRRPDAQETRDPRDPRYKKTKRRSFFEDLFDFD
jgi:Zn-finger nucleic acid-binding protein